MGQGRYADKLSQRDWEDLNNAQRAHYNYLEQLPLYITSLVSHSFRHALSLSLQPVSSDRPTARLVSLLCAVHSLSQCVAGLTYPRVSVVLGAGLLVGRFLYGQGYRGKGAAGRVPGVLLADAAMAGLIATGALSAWSIGGGASGMQNALKSFTKF